MKLLAHHDGADFEVEVRSGVQSRQFEVLITDGAGTRTTVAGTILNIRGERWTLESDGRVYDLLVQQSAGQVLVDDGKSSRAVELHSSKDRLGSASRLPQDSGLATVRAQMPGKVVRVLKETGDTVAEGEGVVIVEAMKMQNEIRAPRAGRLVACSVAPGESVASGDILFEIE